MISIVIPCFNHNMEVQSAVQSALAQTYTDLEVVVVDDGSCVPVGINCNDTRVRLIRHPSNLGLPAALNTGIRESRGDRFVILASDDGLDRQHLECTSKYNTDIVSCGFRTTPTGDLKSSVGSLEALTDHNCHTYAALVKKSMWEKVGGFKTYMNPSWEDWEFWLNCAKHGATWHYVPKPLHIYHRNPVGRDTEAQGKETLLWGKMHGAHQDLYGKGAGVVAFVIPCYKHEKFVGEAVQSVVNQVYPHTVAVVVDDGSPGNVFKAVQATNPPDDRVLVVSQDNKGLSCARNVGINAAFEYFDPEYMVMLDADDTVDDLFVETMMPQLEDNRYAYCDIRFIGDAWHVFKPEEYDCHKLVKKHLHQCTFLASVKLWREVIDKRGFAYDEHMKEGYEDWEFALAAVESSWCGKKVDGPYFQYRFHKDGSMRTDARKVNDKLFQYIVKQHPWIASGGSIMAGCTSCGGRGKFTRTSLGTKGGVQVFVQGLGQIESTDPVYVRYSGSTTSTITKIGMGGTIYKYSADPEKSARGYGPEFTIYSRDAHMFQGPYAFSKTPWDQPQPVVVALAPLPAPTVLRVVETNVGAERANGVAPVARMAGPNLRYVDIRKLPAGKEKSKDNFTKLSGVDDAGQQKLYDAGFSYYQDILGAESHELASILGLPASKLGVLKASVGRMIKMAERKGKT